MLELNSDNVVAHASLGNLLAKNGQIDAAIAHYRAVLKAQPDHVDAHANLGWALYKQGKIAEAVAHWREAVRVEPSRLMVVNQLAWVLATCPDASIRNGAEAVEMARRAVKLSSGKEPAVLGTLAAAYAEVGKFSEAVEVGKRAAAIASAHGNGALADTLRRRIKLYQAGSPYRQTRIKPSK